jgi:electron transfer flavoprotein alpha subunit
MALGAGIVSNCNRAVVDGGELVLTRNTYNGKIQEEKKVTTEKFVVTLRRARFLWLKREAREQLNRYLRQLGM